MKLSPDSLSRHLERQLLPIYLVSGDEPLLAAEAADAIRARARALGFTEREVHAIDRGTDWDAVRAAAGTLSLFAARRIVELRLPSGKPGVTGGRAIASLAESSDADTLILVLTGRLDRDAQAAEWVRAVESHGAWISVWPISADRMVPWLEARCRELGLAADREALEVLAERTQGNLLAARQELEKLKLLAAQPDGDPQVQRDGQPVRNAERITAERVLAAAGDSARFSVGELADALTAREPGRALRILDGLKGEDVELPLVLWAVVRALRARWTRQVESGAARERAVRRMFGRLAARAVRADAIAKGRRAGSAWDEIALLVCELTGARTLPLPTAHQG